MAYCEEYSAVYHIRLDRMAEAAQTGERFRLPELSMPVRQGGLPPKAPFKARLELEASAGCGAFRGRKLVPAGERQYELEFTDAEELIAELMASTAWTGIFSPQ